MRTLYSLEVYVGNGWALITGRPTLKDARAWRDRYYPLGITRIRKWKPA